MTENTSLNETAKTITADFEHAANRAEKSAYGLSGNVRKLVTYAMAYQTTQKARIALAYLLNYGVCVLDADRPDEAAIMHALVDLGLEQTYGDDGCGCFRIWMPKN